MSAPPRRATFWAAASLIPVALLYGQVSHRWSLAVVALACLLAAPLVGPRVALGLAAERLATVVLIGAASAVAWFGAAATDGRTLLPGWSAAAFSGLLVAAARLYVIPERRPAYPATVLPGLAALTACGETRGGAFFVGATLLHLALVLGAARAHDPGRARIGALGPRHLGALAVVLLVAGGVAAGSIRGLPPLSEYTAKRIVAALGQPRAGFSDTLELGSLQGLLLSEEVVLRVEGPPADYLRGVVYDSYSGGFWQSTPTRRPERRAAASAARAGAERVRVSYVGGGRSRYFAPLAAREVVVEGGDADVDRFGVLRAPEGTAVAASFLVPATSPRLEIPVSDPTRDDVSVPGPLRPTLKALVAEWTRGATGPDERVEAIARHLRTDFTYSLEFTRKRQERMLDFLLDQRRGHCEYFASAMALLAREAGVPARVIGGYRVAEYNPLGGYHVVREKNAHAWVEVFLPGKGWTTIDATPEAGLPQNAPHPSALLSSIADYLSVLRARAWAALLDANLVQVIVVLGLVILVGLVIRWFQRRRANARAEAGFAAWERPPPSVERLLQVLAGRGLARSPAEPLERYAARLDGPDLEPAAGVLRRYAAYRYGGVGEIGPLVAEADTCAERLRKPAP